VINLTRDLALQWARKGVRVNALCPGWFQSEMTAGNGTDEGALRFIGPNSPTSGWASKHELDRGARSSPDRGSTFMTGHSLLIVDCGWTALLPRRRTAWNRWRALVCAADRPPQPARLGSPSEMRDE